MNFNLITRLKDADSLWLDAIFYIVTSFMALSIFCYALFSFKVYLQNQRMNELDQRIAGYGTESQKKAEKDFINYKKELDDFTKLIDDHKSSSKVFSFIEDNTLSNVWFSNFDMTESNYKVKMSGEAKSMDILSKQVSIFEEKKDFVDKIDILSSQSDESGRTSFTIGMSLNPKLFSFGD